MKKNDYEKMVGKCFYRHSKDINGEDPVNKWIKITDVCYSANKEYVYLRCACIVAACDGTSFNYISNGTIDPEGLKSYKEVTDNTLMDNILSVTYQAVKAANHSK